MDPSYNNSFGSFGSGGDIVLTSDKAPTRKKKIPLIICAVFLVIAMVAGISLLFFPKNNGKKQRFNEFANYLLYGKESTDDLKGEYSWGYRYYASNLDTINKDSYKEYLNKLMKKYNAFKDVYDVSDSYNDSFLLFWYAYMYPDPAEGVEYDENNGEELSDEEINNIVTDYYKPLLESGNESVQKYAKWQMSIYSKEYRDADYDVPDFDVDVYYKLWEIKDAING